MHPFRNQVSPALKHELTLAIEVEADVGTVDLLLDD
jgi:hypothetical protein